MTSVTPGGHWHPAFKRQTFSNYEKSLLTFVLSVFEGELVVPRRDAPGRDYRQTYEQIGALCVRGVLRFLIHAGGWQRVAFPEADKISQGRIWEASNLAQPMTVTALGLELFPLLMDALVGELADDGSTKAQLALAANLQRIEEDGSPVERLLRLLVARPLSKLERCPMTLATLTRGSGLVSLWPGCTNFIDVPFDEPAATAALAEWGWCFPWLEFEAAGWWSRLDDAKFGGGVEAFASAVGQLQQRLSCVLVAARQTRNTALLLPVLRFFERQYSNCQDVDAFLEPLEWLTESSRLEEQQHFRDEWGRLLRVQTQLAEVRRHIQRTHPVDREVTEKLFIAAWERLGGERLVGSTERLREALERVLG